jgi:hypothetical protein
MHGPCIPGRVNHPGMCRVFGRAASSSQAACWLALAVQVLHVGCEPQGEIAPVDLPLGSIEEELRIGAIDHPDFAFNGVLALEVGLDGSIYSLHQNEGKVRRWSSAGEPLESIGRRGEGPGEFQMPTRLGWHGDYGGPIGRVEVPSAMRLMMAERSMVWGAERNEFDVDYIVRYRMELSATQ